MQKINLFITDRQMDTLTGVKDWTEVSMSELIRRMIDYGTRQPALNELVPAMSGTFPPKIWAQR